MDKTTIKELFMTFGIVNNVRITKNQKLRYLTIIKQYFENIGFEKIDILKYKVIKKKSYFSVIGDIEKADYIVSTYYDTPVFNLLRQTYEPFNEDRRKSQNSMNYILSMILITTIMLLVTIFIVLPIFQDGVFGFKDILASLISISLLALIIKFSRVGGFPTFGNLIRNTSSVVAILKFASLLGPKEQKKIAFAFVDYGCEDYLGYYALSKELVKKRNQKVIFLDCVGAGNLCQSNTKSEILTSYFENSLFVYGNFKNERKKDYEEGIEASLKILNNETFKNKKFDSTDATI
ncbi:hypothetical protein IGI39_003032 [Enterococcus sp. AZ135]|uniref:hypothetical protein n=1 Tax=unclassified Enterococcus TaxID=2608891 RepID=UPI003F293F49